jgi:hypothetical protein
MKLKQITLLAAIAQLLALLGNGFNALKFLTGPLAPGQSSLLITMPLTLLAQAMLVWFLFVLFSRQRAE